MHHRERQLIRTGIVIVSAKANRVEHFACVRDLLVQISGDPPDEV